jgi:hypothetical protein
MAFPDKKGVILLPTNQNFPKDLIPLVIEGIRKEYRYFYFQNQVALLIVRNHLIAHGDIKFGLEGIRGSQKSGMARIGILPACFGHYHIQTKGDGCWIFNLKGDFDPIGPALNRMLVPLNYVYPLPRTSLLNTDLPRKEAGQAFHSTESTNRDDDPCNSNDAENKVRETFRRNEATEVGWRFLGVPIGIIGGTCLLLYVELVYVDRIHANRFILWGLRTFGVLLLTVGMCSGLLPIYWDYNATYGCQQNQIFHSGRTLPLYTLSEKIADSATAVYE